MADSKEKLFRSLPPETELEEEFVRSASGPGGQNVNKTATAVRLTWRFMESDFLSDRAKERMQAVCNADFVSFLARESRSMPDNRDAARCRLAALIVSVKKEPRKRHATKPTRGSKERRLESKNKRSEIKSGRGKVSPE